MKPIDQLSDDEWLALVQRAMAMPDAPRHAVQRALDLWRQHGPKLAAAPRLRRWVAVLSFDSWARSPVAAGMRAMPSEVRQLVFSAKDSDIDLRIAPTGAGFTVSGQLLGAAAEGRVELAAVAGKGEEAIRRSVTLDELGEFSFDGLLRGVYQVRMQLGEDEIELPAIEVGPPGEP